MCACLLVRGKGWIYIYVIDSFFFFVSVCVFANFCVITYLCKCVFVCFNLCVRLLFCAFSCVPVWPCLFRLVYFFRECLSVCLVRVCGYVC